MSIITIKDSKSLDRFVKEMSVYPVTLNITTYKDDGSLGFDQINIKDSYGLKTITFMGMTLDVDNLDIIINPGSLTVPIRISNLMSLVKHTTGKTISYKDMLLFIQQYKISSKVGNFVESINNYSASSTSVTGQIITKELGVSPSKRFISELLIAVKAICGSISYNLEYKSNIYNYNSYKENYDANILNKLSIDMINRLNDTDLYKMSIPNNGRYDLLTNEITTLKALNVADMTDNLTEGDDIIYSTDVKKSLTKLGFDKICTSRELTSISNAIQSKQIEIVKNNKDNLANYIGRYGNPSQTSISKLFLSFIKIANIIEKG